MKMKLKRYFKNAVKYILYDSKPKQVYVKVDNVLPKNLLKDKIVLITGGSDGIGLSIAKKFTAHGATVIITGRNEEKLKRACQENNISDYIKNDIKNIDKEANNIYKQTVKEETYNKKTKKYLHFLMIYVILEQL